MTSLLVKPVGCMQNSRLMKLFRTLLSLVLMCGCAAAPATDEPDPGRIPAVWDFEFVDADKQPLGSIRLRFRSERIDESYCGEAYFMKADVLQNDLQLDIYKSLQPAWHVFAYGLSIDLTASSCNTNYLLIGSMNATEASGYFNYSHPLGGEYMGRFTGAPVHQADR